jgi:hypothetical protein
MVAGFLRSGSDGVLESASDGIRSGGSMILISRIFFTRTGLHPRVKPEDMLRSKTL